MIPTSKASLSLTPAPSHREAQSRSNSFTKPHQIHSKRLPLLIIVTAPKVVEFGFAIRRLAQCSAYVSLKEVSVFGARVGTQLRVLGSLGRLQAQSGTESSFVILDLVWLVRSIATEFLLSGAAHRIFRVAF